MGIKITDSDWLHSGHCILFGSGKSRYGISLVWFPYTREACSVFYFHGLPIYSPKFTESVRWSSLSFQNGVSPVRATCSFPSSFSVVTYITGSRGDWLEWLEIASCHVAYQLELGKPLVSDICSSCLSFVDCLFAFTVCTHFNDWAASYTRVN